MVWGCLYSGGGVCIRGDVYVGGGVIWFWNMWSCRVCYGV